MTDAVRRGNRVKWVSVFAVALLASTALVLALPVQAGGAPLTEEELSRPLSAAASRILDVAEDEPESGLAGTAIWVATSSVSLYWKGPLSPDVASVVAEVSKDVRVDVVPARFSFAALRRDVNKIMPDYDPSRGTSDYAIQGVHVRYDGSGLIVEARKFTPERRAELLADPYVISLNDKPEEQQLLTRQNDSPPWFAGGRMRVDGDGACSTGFAVQAGSINYLLSAGHCANDTNLTTVRDGTYSDILGTLTSIYGSVDTMLIDVTGSSEARMFDQGWNQSTNHNVPVRGWSHSTVNDYVCASGSVSGIRCNLKIIDINYPRTVMGFKVWGHKAQQQTAGGVAAANGDSGAPVVTNVPSPAYARGTLAAGFEPLDSCPSSVDTSVPVTCYHTLWFVPISTILSTTATTLMTATS